MGFDIYRKYAYVCEVCGKPGSSEFTPNEKVHPGQCRLLHRQALAHNRYERLKKQQQNCKKDEDELPLKLFVWDGPDVPKEYQPVFAYAVNEYQARQGVATKIWGDGWKDKFLAQIKLGHPTEFDWLMKDPRQIKQPWFGSGMLPIAAAVFWVAWQTMTSYVLGVGGSAFAFSSW